MDLRHRAEELGIPLPRFFTERPEDLPSRLREMTPRYFFVEDLEETKRRLILNLLLLNGEILIFSSLAGYFLAGKTLKPIENALEEQKRFVADASHELRTPLTALKTSLEVALRDKKMALADAKNVLEDNLEEVESLKSLSDKLLSLTRYQSNGQNLAFKEVNIREVIQKAVKKVTPLAKEKEIEVKLSFDSAPHQKVPGSAQDKLSGLKLEGNKESLEEMLLIFLDNGVKYTPKGGRVTIEGQSNKKSYVIKVKDTGIGIAKDELPHIFDRFYRADQSRSKEKVSGFGLGLSLAKKIIEIHKGTVEVASVLGKGTTFTIKLPLK